MQSVALLVFVALFGGFFIWIFSLLRKQIGRVFTGNYNELSRSLGTQGLEEEYSGMTGSLATNAPQRIFPSMNFRLRGLLKVDVYRNQLVVGALGKGIVLPYTQYIFEREKGWLRSCLVIKGLAVTEEHPLDTKEFPVDFDRTTTLRIFLSDKEIDFIMSLVCQAQQSSREK